MSVPLETVLYEFLQCESFSQAAVFVNCSSVGPFHGVPSFRNKLLQCGSLLGSWVLLAKLLQYRLLSSQGTDPARSLLHGVLVSTGWIHLLQCGSLHELEEASLLLHGLHHERCNTCSSAWSTSFSCFFTDFDVRTVSHTYSHSSPLKLWTRFSSPSYLCYHRSATATADCLSFGQQFCWS